MAKKHNHFKYNKTLLKCYLQVIYGIENIVLMSLSDLCHTHSLRSHDIFYLPNINKMLSQVMETCANLTDSVVFRTISKGLVIIMSFASVFVASDIEDNCWSPL